MKDLENEWSIKRTFTNFMTIFGPIFAQFLSYFNFYFDDLAGFCQFSKKTSACYFKPT